MKFVGSGVFSYSLERTKFESVLVRSNVEYIRSQWSSKDAVIYLRIEYVSDHEIELHVSIDVQCTYNARLKVIEFASHDDILKQHDEICVYLDRNSDFAYEPVKLNYGSGKIINCLSAIFGTAIVVGIGYAIPILSGMNMVYELGGKLMPDGFL